MSPSSVEEADLPSKTLVENQSNVDDGMQEDGFANIKHDKIMSIKQNLAPTKH